MCPPPFRPPPRPPPNSSSCSAAGRSPLGAAYAVKYSYVCVVAMRFALQSAYEIAMKTSLPAKSWPGVCTDGLNGAGLAIALQWNRDVTAVEAYNGTGPAVDQIDASAYILANYKTVAEVRAALEGGLRVTFNQRMNLSALVIVGFPYIPW